jgi:hypothetical protein
MTESRDLKLSNYCTGWEGKPTCGGKAKGKRQKAKGKNKLPSRIAILHC